MDKTLVADLLNLAKPRNLSPYGGEEPFRFPFFTIEALTLLDDRTIAVLNDNEYITIQLSHRLHADWRLFG